MNDKRSNEDTEKGTTVGGVTAINTNKININHIATSGSPKTNSSQANSLLQIGGLSLATSVAPAVTMSIVAQDDCSGGNDININSPLAVSADNTNIPKSQDSLINDEDKELVEQKSDASDAVIAGNTDEVKTSCVLDFLDLDNASGDSTQKEAPVKFDR